MLLSLHEIVGRAHYEHSEWPSGAYCTEPYHIILSVISAMIAVGITV